MSELASCSECVKVWDLPEETPVSTFAPHKKTINSLRWAGHTKCIATVSDDGSLMVSKKGGGPMINFVATRSALNCLTFLPGRKFVVTGGADRALRAWSVSDGRQAASYAVHSDAVVCVDAAAVGDVQLVASGDAAGVAVVHNASANWTMSRTLSAPDSTGLRALAFDRHRRDSAVIFATDGGLVAEWDVVAKSTAPIWSIRGHQLPCTAVAQSPVSRSLVASVGLDKRLVLISPSEQQIIKEIAFEAPLTALDFHGDGHTLAIGTSSGLIFIYDLRSSSSPRAHTLKAHSPNPVNCLQYLKSSASTGAAPAPAPATAAQTKAVPAPALAAAKAPPPAAAPVPPVSAAPKSLSTPGTTLPKASVLPSPPSVVAKEEPPQPRPTPEQPAPSPVPTGPTPSEQHPKQATPQSQESKPPSIQTTATKVEVSLSATTTPSQTTLGGTLGFGMPLSTGDAGRSDPRRRSAGSTAVLSTPQEPPAVSPIAQGTAVAPPAVATAPPATAVAQAPQAPTTMPTPGELQVNLMKKLIEDAQFEFRQQMHTDIINLHVDMIRGFSALKAEFTEMMRQHLGSVQELIKENERLREEVRKLKNLY